MVEVDLVKVNNPFSFFDNMKIGGLMSRLSVIYSTLVLSWRTTDLENSLMPVMTLIGSFVLMASSNYIAARY